MNVKNNIKKVLAVAASAALVGTTLVGALAYDLSSYPAPFVQNGVMNGAIVVGANAATTDVLGAIDIAASLQAEAVTPVAATGASASTTVQGGVLIEDNTGLDLNFNEAISTNDFDDQDMSVLADGTLSDEDGSDYDYTQSLLVDFNGVEFSTPGNNVYDKPVASLDLDAASHQKTLTYTLDFEDNVDFTLLDDSESFDMFGKSYTVKNIASTTEDIVLYASDVSEIVTMGTPLEVSVDGTTHTVEIMGANSDGSFVNLAVDGDTKSMQEGESSTISGVEVYVQEVFISNVAGESAAAKVFIGSKELNIGNAVASPSGTQVKVNGANLDGVEAFVTGSDNSAVDKIVFEVTAKEVTNVDTDDEYKWLALGDTFKDPLFGFTLDFTEAVSSFTADSRDLVSFDTSSNTGDFAFVNADGDEINLELYKDDNSDALTYGDDLVIPTNVSGHYVEGNIFLATEDYTGTEPVSRLLEVDKVKLDGTVEKTTFVDSVTGKEYTVDNTTLPTMIGDTNIQVDAMDYTADQVDLTLVNSSSIGDTSANYVFTKDNTKVTFAAASGSPSTATVTVLPDAFNKNYDEVTASSFTVQYSMADSASDVKIASPGFTASDEDDANKVEYGVDDYGVYYEQDADDSSWLKLYVPAEDVDYNVYLAPPDAVTVTSAATGSSYQVNPIALGLGVLDTDVTFGSEPMIIVGGPYANTIAADFLGNPDDAAIAETFSAGKAMIKYDDANQAMLVAGYDAQDTQGACYVVANHGLYDFSGNELEVVVTDLNNIVVN